MKKYFLLQCKRLLRFLPGGALVILILLGSLLGIFSLMMQDTAQNEENQKISLALVGHTDDPFLKIGLTAITSFDSIQYSLDIRQMEEEQAADALAKGKISAYVVIPENFMDEAFVGNILPLRFVTTTNATGLVTLFTEEITDVICQVLLAAQKGVFGMADAVEANGLTITKDMDRMSAEYGAFVFSRNDTYALSVLGVSDQLGLEGYLLCGLTVLFLLLSCLPFGPMMIRSDHSLSRMLASGGCGPFRQSLCDFAVYAAAQTVTVLAVLGIAGAFGFHKSLDIDLGQFLLRIIPVILMTAAFSFLLYRLTTDLISGILLQFLTTIALCFVSGCMYPVYFFPTQVQTLAAWLPAGIARSQLSGSITGESAGLATALLLLYSGAFFLMGSLVHCRRVKEVHP